MSEKRTWLEWLVLGLATPLVLGVLAFLIYQAVSTKPETDLPQLTVVPNQKIEKVGEEWRVKVAVTNQGIASAEQVGAEVSLEGAPSPEAVDFEVQRLAPEAKIELYVMFSQDPQAPGRKLAGRIRLFRVP